jgi:two-component system chemotaxis response regulator CheY
MWISSSRRSPQSFPDAEPADLRERRLLALVVGEDPGLRRIIRTQLQAIRVPGMAVNDPPGVLSVVEADSGRSALSVLSAIAPSVVVLDLILPELSGYELCERLRASATLHHVPILAMSARAMPEDRAAAEEAGASAFLAKPFTARELTEHVLPLLSIYTGNNNQ